MSYPEAASGDFLAGFMDDYFAECDEHLTSVRRILAEAQPALAQGLPSAALEELFRSFHSIKGLSGMVQLRDAELLAHHMESYLRLLRSGEAPFTAVGLDGLINGTSLLERVIAARRNNQPGPAISAALAQLDALAPATRLPVLPEDESVAEAAAPVPVEPDGSRWRVHFDPSPERAARGITVDRIRARLQEVADIVDAAPKIGTGGAIRFEFTLTDVSDPAIFDQWTEDGITAAPITATPAQDAAVPRRRLPRRGTKPSSPRRTSFVSISRALTS